MFARYSFVFSILLLSISHYSSAQEVDSTENDSALLKVEVQPEFPGGIDKMMEFINEEIKYPRKARNMWLTGLVVISFIVNEEGEITKAKVVKSSYGDFDIVDYLSRFPKEAKKDEEDVFKKAKAVHNQMHEEALRVVNEMPSWEPGKQDGAPVKVVMNLPVRFSLK